MTPSDRERLVRIESKQDQLLEHKVDQEKRIRSLEKKWWTTLGAAVLSLLAFLKSIIT